MLSPFEGRNEDRDGRPKDLLGVFGLVAFLEGRVRARLGRWAVVIVCFCWNSCCLGTFWALMIGVIGRLGSRTARKGRIELGCGERAIDKAGFW